MKSRLKRNEAALLLVPVLVLGGFALYSQRTEKSTRQGLYVASAEMVPATPLDASRGNSHLMKITLDYGGPKPNWWLKGDAFQMQSHYDYPKSSSSAFWRDKPGPNFSEVQVITTTMAGKTTRLKKQSNWSGSLQNENGRYFIIHYLNLASQPRSKGALTLRTAYRMRDLPPLMWQGEVRKAGKTAALSVDRKPHAKIVSLRARDDFAKFQRGFAASPSAALRIDIQVRHLPRDDGRAPVVNWNKVEIIQKGGRFFKYVTDFNLGFTTPTQVQEDPILLSNTLDIMSLSPALQKARGPLTLRGTISVNERWPQPFSLLLKAR